MNHHILAAIRSQPWAILPHYLAAIEAIALRIYDNPALLAVQEDGHVERQPSAVALMGQRAPATRTAMLRDGVGMLPITGPVFPRANIMTEMSGATSLDIAAADLRALQASPDVKSILVVMDTPGGAVAQINDFGRLIAASSKPVAVHVTGMCCSAGYWIASQGTGGISADSTCLIGNIGVVVSADYQVEPDSQGYRSIDIVSTNAPNKRPDLSTEEGRAQIRQMLDGVEAVFIQAVARGRGVSEATVRNDFGRGASLAAADALSAGLIDRIEADGLDGAITRLAGAAPKPSRNPSRRTAAASLQLAQIRARNH